MPTLVNASGGFGGGYNSTLLATLSTVPSSYTAISGTESWKKYDAIYATVLVGEYLYTVTIYTDTIKTSATNVTYCVSDMRTTSYWGITYIAFSDSAISAVVNKTDNVPVTDLKIYGIKY